MSISGCLTKLQAYLKESGEDKKLSDQRLNEYAKKLEALQADALTPLEFKGKAQELLDIEEKRLNQAAKLDRALRALKRIESTESILNNADIFKQQIKDGKGGIIFKDNPAKMAVEAFRNWIQGGGLRPGEGTNLSVEKMSKAIEASLRDTFNIAVGGIKDIIANGALDKLTWEYKYKLDAGLPLPEDANQTAVQYAKALKAWQDRIFQIKQAYSPYLEAAKDYMFKQFHDPEKIRAMGKDNWTKLAMETYGEKSFPTKTLAEKQKIFEGIYDDITNGNWGDDTSRGNYSEGGNIARRFANERKLIAKDWESAYEYQKQAGYNTIYEGVDRHSVTASRSIAKLSKFGSLPDDMFEQVFNAVKNRLSPEEAKFFDQKQKEKFKDMFDVAVHNSQGAPATGTGAKITQGAMTLQYLAKTGGAWLRSLPDIGISASLIRDLNGKNIFQNAASLASEYAKAFVSSKYASQQMENVGLFAKSAHLELMRSLGSAENGPGKIAGLAEKMGSLNLLNRHVDAMRSAVGTVLTKVLGDATQYKFEVLPDSFQQGLKRYGIGEQEWNLMRLSTENIDGYKVVTPEAMKNLPDVAAENYLRSNKLISKKATPSARQLDLARFELATKLGAMINEHADLGSAHPDIRQRTFLWGDTDINDGMGMLSRLVTQFKTAALVENDVYRRNYFSGQGLKSSYAGIASHMALSMFLYTLGEYAKGLANGKTPEDPATPEFAIKMLAGSGAPGIMGDVFINEFERQGITDKTLAGANALLGPTIGTGLEAGAVGSQLLSEATMGKHSVTGGTARRATSLVMSNAPAVSTLHNLWWTKSIFDFYVTNAISEIMDHGFLKHLEKGTEKRGQTYLFARPTSSTFTE